MRGTLYGVSASVQGVVESKAVIVPPKTASVQVKFRWPPDLLDEIRAIAERTGRSQNEAGERLMRWAIERAKVELEMAGEPAPERRRK